MPECLATEFRNDTCEPTSRKALYRAGTVEESVKHCLDTHRLPSGFAHVGLTGRIVHTGFGTSLVVTSGRSCPPTPQPRRMECPSPSR